MMKRILLAALLAGSQAAMAKDCETESGGATMSAVYACMQNEQYKFVNATYQKLERKLLRKPDLLNDLRASQVSWEKFVSDSCGFLSNFDQGEMGWADANYSCHRGVSRRGDRWQVVVRINGKLKWLGVFDSEEDAAAVAAPHFAGIAA
jgi:uncharacterized protein YecT (DUF1311 family)